MANRWACLHDLNNYFKIKDLLGGLTEPEKAKVRENLGIVDQTGEGGQTSALNITYSALNDLITSNSLVVGARYIITDFRTIYPSNVLNTSSQKITWGDLVNPSPITQLIVIANTNNTLDQRVYLVGHPEWSVNYNVAQEVLEDGVKTKGKITYLKDSNGNSAYYDFKNIKFRRTSVDLENSNLDIQTSFIDLYTFSDILNGVVIDNSDYESTKYNILDEDCWDNVFLGDTYNNHIEAACKRNTFLRGCHDSTIKWNSVDNFFNENVCYLEGSIYNKTIPIGNTDLSMTITKTVQKVNDATIVSYLDPITYSYQIVIL